ncbi:Haloacid dehalogenase superfamily, subfamily IA, variant 2 with 3rd motif like haloacid dehalogenase/haloacid dehalogenase superfamily, subfamily IA, variant 3 with third motif having DD or ED [Modicisalibacter ilicicola DSM 19980]|uniref:Haloacid dehalogenase superfamily, subfamily IA, variant 2 with 3rd motif like haloacid dehalogenase/haloacid dehalogenase superfamily, subfamily IA, variant 3 with third motif having DD or ED n=1 Tax=Modicisalibacter ilicicola DSM 19980 TaxID=1121942 RepID=A0A1M4UFM3_9GAMM|nr:HAD-IA family hydrolase [Halomonas ilicicola]SHE55582.1 Haloacid dehalogenase superfamily, subfamily IA, variant 2 with 3rd motif like haloacid dehalogenase/haloacid dehalogenase superfamily, subfamily IA, variant 3 with third motif having DD or ED [Halomonas ilicicola DSM 19980]
MPRELLIFDCDGVLVDSETLAEGVLRECLAAWLPDLHAETELRQALGMTTRAILEKLVRRSAHDLPHDALARIEQAIEARLATDLRAIDGIAEAIRAIDLPLAIVSNSGRHRVESSLTYTGLSAALGDVPLFTAEQVERPKPHPDVYQLAARSLGCAPRDCLVVEDSVSGVTAAHAAEMMVIGFIGASHIEPGHDRRLMQAGAWQVLPEMRHLASLVARWRRARNPVAGV